MDTTEIGRLVTALIIIPHVTSGEPSILPGTVGRVVRVDPDRGLVCVRWQRKGSLPTDIYCHFGDIEVVLEEGA